MGLLAERKHDPEKQEGARVLPSGAALKLPEDGYPAQNFFGNKDWSYTKNLIKYRTVLNGAASIQK